MQKPYRVSFSKPAIKLSRERPSWSRFSFTPAKHHLFRIFYGAQVYSRWLNMPPFYIELFEARADTQFRIHYEVLEKQHFLFFMLQGCVNVQTPEGFYVCYAGRGQYSFHAQASGKYVMPLSEGKYTALCIVISPEWLRFFSEDQSELRNFLTAPTTQYDALPYCRIDPETADRLKALYAGASKGAAVLDGTLRYYISLILEQYGVSAGERLKTLPYLLRNYLDDHYRQPDLSQSRLAQHFQVTERTLRDRFKTEFNTTPHHYYTCRRISYALDLLRQQDTSLGKIYHEAGYNDESTFRYEMKRFGLL